MESLIYGMLLGDSAISVSGKTPFLQTVHCKKQIDYLKWKASMLGFKGKILQVTSGYGFESFRFSYYNEDILHSVYDTCVIGGKKKVTQAWLDKLDTLSLAIWYQDDGSWGMSGKRRKCGGRGQLYSNFHTQGFDSESNHLLAEWLVSKGYHAVVKPHKKKYEFIQLNHTATKKLWVDIAPYMFLTYKLDNVRGDIDFCSCGKNKQYSQTLCDECLYNLVIASNHLPRRERNRVAEKAINRFGTSSAKKLISQNIAFNFPSQFRIDPEIIGSKVLHVPIAKQVE